MRQIPDSLQRQDAHRFHRIVPLSLALLLTGPALAVPVQAQEPPVERD